MLNINTDKVCYLVVKAREFDVKEAPEGMYDGSDAADDGFAAVLEDTPDDLVFDLHQAGAALSVALLPALEHAGVEAAGDETVRGAASVVA